MAATPRSGNPSVRQGAIVGVVLGIIFAIVSLISSFTSLGAAGTILGYVLLLVGLVGFGYAGYRASTITGRIGSGAIAGLMAGLISYVISAIVSIILAFALTDTIRQRALDQLGSNANGRALITNQFVITSTIGSAIFSIVLGIALGAALGAIGGAIGRRRAPQAAPYQESLYQGGAAPTSNQGVPPAQDSYPTQNPPPPTSNYQ